MLKIVLYLRSCKDDEQGSFGIMAAVTMLMLAMCIGVSVDSSRAFQAHEKLQSLSDNVGLHAAIYIKDHKVPPKSQKDGYLDGVSYDLKVLNGGKEIPGMSGNMIVTYNDSLKRAEVLIEGEMTTAFMGAFQKPTVDISVTSQVQYFQTQQAATSVFLVVDNSGSMAWDDTLIASGNRRASGAETRIQGLKSTVLKFNEDLDASLREAISENGEKYLRTALIPYSSQTLTSKISKPDWGTISVGHVNRMKASGGTDSRGPLEAARKLMEPENDIHFAENGTRDPKKYVIFMTDGSNNEEWVCDWRNRSLTGLWRRFNGTRYEYYRSWRSPGSGFTEGVATNCKLENKSNSDSVSTCKKLKNENVEVFTVGFALEPGKYFANYPASRQTATISRKTTDAAYDFLRSCASSEDKFIVAKDSDALNAAFEKIGQTIAQDSIRISG